jgi:hypothetical protein
MYITKGMYNQVNATSMILFIALFTVSIWHHWWWLVVLSLLCGFSMLFFCEQAEAG